MAKKRPEKNLWYLQYLKLKAKYPDAVLLYRLGDFYEVFDDDAKLVAGMLGVTLTRKKCGSDERGDDTFAPMAGMPYHAVDNYIGKLVEAGYRVAVAEQMGLTEANKRDTRPRSSYAPGEQAYESERLHEKIEHREVVRVITPGTRTDSSMLHAHANNYLAAVMSVVHNGELLIGLAYADLTTGEFAATQWGGERARIQLEGELARLGASEVLVPDDPQQRPASLSPASARMEIDLAPMTRQERAGLLRHERVARTVEGQNEAEWSHGHVTALPAWRWEQRTAEEALLRQLRARTLGGFGLADKPLAARAAGALVQYLHETQRSAVQQISSLRCYSIGSFMFLDPQTRRNLALTEGATGTAKGSLVKVLNAPLLDRQALLERQRAVARFVDDGMLRAETRDALRSVGDLERTVNRVVQGIAHPRDLANLRESLRALPRLVELLDGSQGPGDRHGVVAGNREASELPEPQTPNPDPLDDDPFALDDDDLFGGLFAPANQPDAAAGSTKQVGEATRRVAETVAPRAELDVCGDVLALLERALDEAVPALLGASDYLSGEEGARRVIRRGYSPEMDKIITMSRDAKRWIANLETKEKERTGLKSLKVGYNKVFGYYIELPRNVADQVPARYERKQTLVGSERYVTEEMKQFESVVITAETRLNEMERDAFEGLCAEVAAQAPRLLATAAALAEHDVAAGLAEAAVRGRYVRPLLRDDEVLRVTGGRHAIVERSLEGEFIANDTRLDTDSDQVLILTGPNMAGKSTFLRQVALIVLMAQIGSFVPADSAEVGLVDRIFTRIGAQDDIATGQSTFMVEMTETAALLAQSTRRSLIILDEVGRGTSTYDGMAIARAVVEYIHSNPRLQCRTLFATHYHELTDMEAYLPRVRNYHVAVVEQGDQIVFLHEVRRGGADRSYGIHVAELAGIPRPVIARAKELLAELEGHAGRGQGPNNGEHHALPFEPETPVEAQAAPDGQSLLEGAPRVLVEMLRRMEVEELTPIEALTKLYELKRLASEPRP
jgi:DNA mismatch repair protein MutS